MIFCLQTQNATFGKWEGLVMVLRLCLGAAAELWCLRLRASLCPADSPSSACALRDLRLGLSCCSCCLLVASLGWSCGSQQPCLVAKYLNAMLRGPSTYFQCLFSVCFLPRLFEEKGSQCKLAFIISYLYFQIRQVFFFFNLKVLYFSAVCFKIMLELQKVCKKWQSSWISLTQIPETFDIYVITV